ncbi:alanine racemase, partial [Prochlorococcus sp. AH-736-B08]|nr:alanine racemase [Prochlorococcus sp. AH-736-B08]
MQIRQKNQEFNLDKYPTFEKDIDPKQRAWIEVRGKSLETNVRQLRSKLSKSCQFMAVVKADGYGHDAKVVSEYAIKGGASQLGVATLKEGIRIRSFGIKKPILILGNLYTKRDLIISFKNDLMPTISSLRECLICNNIGKHFGLKFSLHLKVDTGMSRLGFECNKFLQQFETIKSFENISIKGIYSHLSSADELYSLDPESTTQKQKKKFQELLNQIKVDRNQNIMIHLANSAGMLIDKNFHFDMVRVGLSMYGYSPLEKIDKSISLKSALFLKVKVAFIRIIDKGVGVSYGGKFISS